MNIYIFEDSQTLYEEAARQVISLVRQKPDAVLGLATGISPLGLYRVLIDDHQKNRTSYQHVTTYNLDEYLGLAPDHPQSYRHYMHEHLFTHIDINSDHTHIPHGDTDNPPRECRRYNELLTGTTLDLQVLGIGSNGHIGFNEPGTPFDLETHVIALDEKTRQDNAVFFAQIDDVPTHAITMGIANIMRARTIVLVAIGAKKAQAVKQMIQGAVDNSCPASVLQTHRDVHLYLDIEAAKHLS
ncbi:MAG: glucosamine-6-phosphate deaminase [Acholeplasmataceae bacterium]|nr:MAG: glucosamine-6-phosphate deaminase [Acholeplasmataceae bacterium]